MALSGRQYLGMITQNSQYYTISLTGLNYKVHRNLFDFEFFGIDIIRNVVIDYIHTINHCLMIKLKTWHYLCKDLLY